MDGSSYCHHRHHHFSLPPPGPTYWFSTSAGAPLMSPLWKQVTECARHTERYLLGVGKELVLGEGNKDDNYVHVDVITYFVFEISTISSKNIYRNSKTYVWLDSDWLGEKATPQNVKLFHHLPTFVSTFGFRISSLEQKISNNHEQENRHCVPKLTLTCHFMSSQVNWRLDDFRPGLGYKWRHTIGWGWLWPEALGMSNWEVFKLTSMIQRLCVSW